MNLVADEGVDRQIVERLREDGFEVLYIAELEPGTPDDVVLDRANEQRALLLTFDKDFRELIFLQKRLTSGVILLRLAGLSSERKAAIVSNVLKTHFDEMVGAFTVVSPGAVRIRPR
ncbi:MAG TPA: DUF5615 family PIN-like protein [Ardenticatenaceae bacterium]|jgi:predicted nuclease of predicted toxin-antitoxin system